MTQAYSFTSHENRQEPPAPPPTPLQTEKFGGTGKSVSQRCAFADLYLSGALCVDFTKSPPVTAQLYRILQTRFVWRNAMFSIPFLTGLFSFQLNRTLNMLK